jgi:hypothetical protein
MAKLQGDCSKTEPCRNHMTREPVRERASGWEAVNELMTFHCSVVHFNHFCTDINWLIEKKITGGGKAVKTLIWIVLRTPMSKMTVIKEHLLLIFVRFSIHAV